MCGVAKTVQNYAKLLTYFALLFVFNSRINWRTFWQISRVAGFSFSTCSVFAGAGMSCACSEPKSYPKWPKSTRTGQTSIFGQFHAILASTLKSFKSPFSLVSLSKYISCFLVKVPSGKNILKECCCVQTCVHTAKWALHIIQSLRSQQ